MKPEDETPEQAARRELIDPVQKWGPRLARAFFILIVILILIGLKLGSDIKSNTDGLGHVVKEQTGVITTLTGLVHTLEDRQVKGCHRTNVERRVANVQSYADYKFFSFTITAIGRSIEHPERPTTPKERKLGRQYLAGLQEDIAKKAYVPLTFCRQALKHDITRIYEPPSPVSFASIRDKHGKPKPPPPTAFKLQEGQ